MMVFPAQGFGQKALGGRCIAFGREKEVDRRTGGVHGQVQARPFAFHPHVRLVHPPRVVCWGNTRDAATRPNRIWSLSRERLRCFCMRLGDVPDSLMVSVPAGFPISLKRENRQFLARIEPSKPAGEAILSRNCQFRSQKRKFPLNAKPSCWVLSQLALCHPKIGTTLKRKTVCCAVRRGAVAIPTFCLPRIAATDNADRVGAQRLDRGRLKKRLAFTPKRKSKNCPCRAPNR
jgi:hypothetical protein